MVFLSGNMNERGNVSLELVLGFGLFVGLLMPAILDFSHIIQTHQRLNDYLGVLGRGWSMAQSQQSEITLISIQSALSKDKPFTMKYSCEPSCTQPEAQLTLKLTMHVDSVFVGEMSVKGTFARDLFSQ